MIMPPIHAYFDQLTAVLQSVDTEALDAATGLLMSAYDEDSTIYVIGNGQSATSSTAFALDLTKQSITSPLQRRVRILSLTDDTAALTAWANDMAYEQIFTEQLKTFWRPRDLLVAVSVSGNSPNIIHACQWVHAMGGKSVALAGFDGGALRAGTDACVVVSSSDFGIVETAHVAIMHYWVDLFREKLAS